MFIGGRSYSRQQADLNRRKRFPFVRHDAGTPRNGSLRLSVSRTCPTTTRRFPWNDANGRPMLADRPPFCPCPAHRQFPYPKFNSHFTKLIFPGALRSPNTPATRISSPGSVKIAGRWFTASPRNKRGTRFARIRVNEECEDERVELLRLGFTRIVANLWKIRKMCWVGRFCRFLQYWLSELFFAGRYS